MLVFFLLFCFLGPVLYHSNQADTNPLSTDLPPGGGHPLGTDDNGFDELGRIMAGGQTALEIGFFAALIATVIGTLYGAVAGLAGGFVDGVMMRFVDVLLSIPFLFIVLILATKYSAHGARREPDHRPLLVAGAGAARARRGADAARARLRLGRARDGRRAAPRLVFRHLIPNALSVVIVNVTFQIADAILTLAFLGFLGFGLQYPTASWGDMLGNAQNYVTDGYWWLVYPVGGCLVLVVLACNLVGDALRDALDVRLRRR